MVAVTITDDATGAIRKLSETMGEDIARKTFEAAEVIAGFVRREVFNVFDVRTGNLARSWKASVVETREGETVAGAFSDLVYADIQDRGGVIRPSRRSFLAVPLSFASVPLGKWPRDFPRGELKLIPRRGKDSLLAKVSRRGGLEPKFVLKRQVTIRPTGYVDSAARKAEPEVAEVLGGAVDLAIKREIG